MKRDARILCLAWSLPDVQPAPVSGASADQVRGPSPTEWAVCPMRCVLSGLNAGGYVRVDKFGREWPCETCRGSGRVRVDPYTGSDVSSAEALTLSRTRRVDCDGCGGTGERRFARCGYCDGAGKVSVPLVPPGIRETNPSRLRLAEGEVRKLRDTGSYDELEQALARLRPVYPRAWAVWLTVRVEGSTDVEMAGGWLRAGDRFVNEFMPPHIRVPGPVRTAWERALDGPRRDDRIRARYRRGEGSAAIATAEGVTVRRVQQIVSSRGNGRAAA